MRKLLFIFFIVILSPTYLMADCNLNTNSTGCISYNGCYFFPATEMLDPDCRQCPSGTYNTDSLETTNPCTPCPTLYGVSGKIPNPDAYTDGQSECPWKCDSNYYKSGDNCEICPTGATSLAGSNSITDCHCSNWKRLIRNNDGTYICGTCSQNSKYNSTTYTCDCATGADNNCQCTNNSSYDQTNNKCICNNSNFPNSSTDENGVVFCSACHQNATYAEGACKCNKGYYGNGNTCTACPYGTTSAVGSIDVSNCQMTTNTQFCDANGENCMKLLSGATHIN